MSKKLVYAFGPDGAGKSSVIGELQAELPGVVAFNASQPQTWPDTSWHEEIQSKGHNPNTLDPEFHKTSIRHSYRMASCLLRSGEASLVIIDSDLQAKAAAKVSAWYAPGTPVMAVYDTLEPISQVEIGNDITKIGLHVTIGKGSTNERAEELMRRVAGRGEASFYDPTSTEHASALILAFDALAAGLRERTMPLIQIETDVSFDPAALTQQLLSD
jgi:hypothetical protein